MLVWGSDFTQNLSARYNVDADKWTNIPPSGLEPRRSASVIWTGREMIIWGGSLSMIPPFYNNGACYNPLTNSWTPVAPTTLHERANHTAVWTGDEMIVWGGYYNTSYEYSDRVLNDGGRFNPNTNTWTELPHSLLDGRSSHSAIWIGGSTVPAEMIVWGGWSEQEKAEDGARLSLSAKENFIPLVGR